MNAKNLVALAFVLAVKPALALSVAGAIDPVVGLSGLVPYALTLGGISIVLICSGKGVHASAEGRHVGPYVAGAIGGTGLTFGGAYLLTHYGVI